MTNFDGPEFQRPRRSPEEVEQIALSQWQGGALLEAMETVLGYRVDARDLQNRPDLAEIVLIPDPSQAYAGLRMIKAVEQLAAESEQ